MSDAIKLWLIRAILSGGRHEDGRDPQFDAAQWRIVQRSAGQHRLRPLLHTFATGPWRDWAIPATLRERWEKAYRRSAQRHFDFRNQLLEVTGVFDAIGCRYAVLKGGALVGAAYPDPAVRAIRDLDILVPRDRAGEAFAALVASGDFVPVSQVTGYLLEDYTDHKHLEPLWCEQRRVTIELHVSLADKSRGADDILFDSERLLGRAVVRKVGRRKVYCLAWPETMLQLIAHGVHDHQLNSGPQMLCDLQAILRLAPTDWDEFWALARAGGWSAAARLSFDLLARFASPAPALDLTASGVPQTPDEVLDAAALLMLQDTAREGGVGAWSRLHAGSGLRATLALIRRRWKSRAEAKKQSAIPIASHSGKRATAKAMLAALTDPADRSELARSRTLYTWLNRHAS